MRNRVSPADHPSTKRLTNDHQQPPADRTLESPPSDSEYRVGPGHPPKQYQFQKGQSGNVLGAKLRKRSIAPDLKALLERALNQKLRKNQGERILTKAAAGMQHLVDQFAQGDRHARRDLIHIAEKLGVDLTAGQGETIQASVAVALTKNDQELIDDFIQHYLAEREHCGEPNNSTPLGSRMIQTEE